MNPSTFIFFTLGLLACEDGWLPTVALTAATGATLLLAKASVLGLLPAPPLALSPLTAPAAWACWARQLLTFCTWEHPAYLATTLLTAALYPLLSHGRAVAIQRRRRAAHPTARAAAAGLGASAAAERRTHAHSAGRDGQSAAVASLGGGGQQRLRRAPAAADSGAGSSAASSGITATSARAAAGGERILLGRLAGGAAVALAQRQGRAASLPSSLPASTDLDSLTTRSSLFAGDSATAAAPQERRRGAPPASPPASPRGAAPPAAAPLARGEGPGAALASCALGASSGGFAPSSGALVGRGGGGRGGSRHATPSLDDVSAGLLPGAATPPPPPLPPDTADGGGATAAVTPRTPVIHERPASAHTPPQQTPQQPQPAGRGRGGGSPLAALASAAAGVLSHLRLPSLAAPRTVAAAELGSGVADEPPPPSPTAQRSARAATAARPAHSAALAPSLHPQDAVAAAAAVASSSGSAQLPLDAALLAAESGGLSPSVTSDGLLLQPPHPSFDTYPQGDGGGGGEVAGGGLGGAAGLARQSRSLYERTLSGLASLLGGEGRGRLGAGGPPGSRAPAAPVPQPPGGVQEQALPPDVAGRLVEHPEAHAAALPALAVAGSPLPPLTSGSQTPLSGLAAATTPSHVSSLSSAIEEWPRASLSGPVAVTVPWAEGSDDGVGGGASPPLPAWMAGAAPAAQLLLSPSASAAPVAGAAAAACGGRAQRGGAAGAAVWAALGSIPVRTQVITARRTAVTSCS